MCSNINLHTSVMRLHLSASTPPSSLAGHRRFLLLATQQFSAFVASVSVVPAGAADLPLRDPVNLLQPAVAARVPPATAELAAALFLLAPLMAPEASYSTRRS